MAARIRRRAVFAPHGTARLLPLCCHSAWQRQRAAGRNLRPISLLHLVTPGGVEPPLPDRKSGVLTTGRWGPGIGATDRVVPLSAVRQPQSKHLPRAGRKRTTHRRPARQAGRRPTCRQRRIAKGRGPSSAGAAQVTDWACPASQRRRNPVCRAANAAFPLRRCFYLFYSYFC